MVHGPLPAAELLVAQEPAVKAALWPVATNYLNSNVLRGEQDITEYYN